MEPVLFYLEFEIVYLQQQCGSWTPLNVVNFSWEIYSWMCIYFAKKQLQNLSLLGGVCMK